MSCKGMSVIASAALVAAGFVGGSMVTSSFAQHDAEKGEHAQMDQQAMMEAWQKAGQLGAEHERLASRAGKWTVSMKHWMDPSQPPEESTATATMKTIMDGRYLVEKFEGTSMGMPFEGMGLSAYDNISKKYKMVWLDNFSTGIMMMEGDRVGDVITTYGTFKDPMGQTQTMKAVCDETDTSAHCEFFMKTPDGGWMKNMELHYTRAE